MVLDQILRSLSNLSINLSAGWFGAILISNRPLAWQLIAFWFVNACLFFLLSVVIQVYEPYRDT